MNKIKFISAILILLIVAAVIIKTSKEPVNEEIYLEPSVSVYLSQKDTKDNLKIEQYITGTVAAEMPASFATEALKAQAVCARTYAFKKLLDHTKYPLGADFSDDISCCQAFITQDEFEERHPLSPALYKKIEKAVNDTRGQIMLYNGQPLDALYSSCCGGQTDSSLYAWGKDVPYLRTVKCPYCKSAKPYKSMQYIPSEQICRQLNVAKPLSIKIIKRSISGRTTALEVNGKVMSAAAFRSAFNLPSTWWEFKITPQKVIVYSRGYGHGLGLCQYGANGMAQSGYNYQQILKHYYGDFSLYKLPY
ncbi:stage II sporulation protein D [Syntrophomonas palmitatica]|uniref:stage II sporulation protein D n=1 Tax=Syntrophomonas palmitatica TaxID=402877 RepID=UPI0006D28B3E|nr:stage II sporulation protein D [Syntrophomonas palmitatica]